MSFQQIAETIVAFILAIIACGILVGLLILIRNYQMHGAEMRRRNLDAIREFKMPDGRVILAYDVSGGVLHYEEFRHEAQSAASVLDYIDAPDAPDRGTRNDALTILRESKGKLGNHSIRILGIGEFGSDFAARWRKATDYLKAWQVETAQVGSPNPGTWVGPLYAGMGVAQLENDVTMRRIPHSPTTSGNGPVL